MMNNFSPFFCRITAIDLFAMAFLFAMGGFFQVIAQSPQEPLKKDQIPELAYKVSILPDSAKTQRDRNMADDDVLLEAELTNITLHPIDVYWDTNGSSTIFQFAIIHEATGRPVPLSTGGLPRTPRPETARVAQFRSIAPGYSLRSQLRIGRKRSISAFFPGPGRYTISPSLVVMLNKVVDEKTGVESEMKSAWTGTVHAEPIALEFAPSANAPAGNGTMAGTVRSSDGDPVDGAIIQLSIATRGATFGRSSDEQQVHDQALSSLDGNFDFVGLPNDADYLLVASHPSHGQQRLPFTFKKFMRREQPVIQFPKRILIRGKVVDAKGLPVSDVRVQEYGTEGSSSHSDGSFQCLAIEKQDNKPYRIDLWKKGWLSTSHVADRPLATSGQWTITMHTEMESTIHGRAVFADETVLAKMPMVIKLAPVSNPEEGTLLISNPSNLQTQTDSEGNFRFALPSMGAFSGSVTVSERKDKQGGERRWSVEVPKITVSDEPLELKFENRGRIDFVVFGTSRLPDSLQPTIALISKKHNYNLEWERTTLGGLGKVRELDGLEPGEYEFVVSLDKSGIERLVASVLVPNREPFHATGKIQIPTIVFGSIRGTLLLPDNQTPADNLKVEVFGSNDFQRSLKTDVQGGIQLEHLPIGDYSMAVSQGNGKSWLPIAFSITDQKPVELGAVLLKPKDEEFGWFDGRIVYEDGTSVGGVYVMNKFEEDFTASTFSSGRISNPKLKPSGDFHLMLPQGKNDLIFLLHGSGRSQYCSARLLR